MNSDLQRDLMAALERPHRLGTIGGDLVEQLAHCASFSAVLGQVVANAASDGDQAGEQYSLRCCDLGTGGGLPGVALAAWWPHTQWTLVDMRTARADEVERTILSLGFQDRVAVRGVEAQYLGHDDQYRETFDVVVARAFGPSSLTAECAAGLVKPGGVFIVSEPPVAPTDDERWDAPALQRLGFGEVRFVQQDTSRFAVIAKVEATPAKAPRLPPRPKRGWFNG